jgi:glycosyl transferase, family 25
MKHYKIYIINMRKNEDRKQYIIDQMNKWNITNYEFIEGIDGNNLDDYILNELVSIDQMSTNLNRQAVKSEMGCALSHKKVYKKIIEEDSPALILEDDVFISVDFKKLVDIKFNNDFDIIFPNNRYVEENVNDWQNLLVGNSNQVINDITFYRIAILGYTFKELWHGAYAYIISPKAAKKIIQINTPVQFESDNWSRFNLQNIWVSNTMTIKHSREFITSMVDRYNSLVEANQI